MNPRLKVLFWKNLVLRKRHWILLIFEAFLPVSLFLLLAYGRSKITGLSKEEITSTTYNYKQPLTFGSSGLNLGQTEIYFSPSTPFFKNLIHSVQEKFSIMNNNIKAFPSEQSLLTHYKKYGNNDTLIAIIFNSAENSTTLDYTIRFHEEYLSWNTDKHYRNEFSFSPGMGTDYIYRGFLTLQMALDMSFIEYMTQKQLDIQIDMLEFPYPPHQVDVGLNSLFFHFLPLITMLSFIFVCPAVLKRVVEEKYSGIKELMRMVGLRSWTLWFGWLVYSIIPMMISVVFITIVMKVPLFGESLIEFTSGSVITFYLILYCFAITVFAFFLSTIFDKPTLAMLVGLLVWILSYFAPTYIIHATDEVQSRRVRLLLMLLPNMALHFGYSTISLYEERKVGVHWSNIHLAADGSANGVNLLEVCGMLMVDILLYLILTLYVDAINPGKYGVRESIFFPFKFLKQLLCSIKSDNGVKDSCQLEALEKGNGHQKGIELVHLTKRYGKVCAVNNLSLEIYKNQITVLLGQNGAGKSTTMGMITGMTRKTGGHILMNGQEVTSRSDLTEKIGLCTQHNLFFPTLTVREHLKFFAMLKGKTCAEANEEVETILPVLHLKEKANDFPRNLSGGMKRKLCLGMAVVGGSEILILDEPSSGMDPESRRQLWDMLLKFRKEKTILITTHFMDEADALADWIAIMNDGQLRCYGTPMYLKKKYETGYNLKVLINKEQKVTETVKKLEDGFKAYNFRHSSIDGYEVSFPLLIRDNYIELFEYLEAKKEEQLLESISFTITTLEDVFLCSRKLTQQNKSTENLSNRVQISNQDKTNANSYSFTCNILRALIEKRWIFVQKKCIRYIIPAIVAFALFIFCILLSNWDGSSLRGEPLLKVNLTSYESTKAYFNGSNDSDVLKLIHFYKNEVINQGSIAVQSNDVSEAIAQEGLKNLPYYRLHMIAGAEFIKNSETIEIVGLYNNIAVHSAPISLNLITNALAKMFIGQNASIITNNHPLQDVNTNQFKVDRLSDMQIGILWLTILPIGIIFFLGSFIYFPFTELSTNFIQLQFMCGVSPLLYWSSLFLVDYGIYLVFAIIMSLLSSFWTPFRGIHEIGSLFGILLLYGLSGIPFAYHFSRRKSFSGAYALYIILGIMLGIILCVIVLILEESGDYYKNTGNDLKKLFLILIPQFGFTYMGVHFSKKVVENYNFNHMVPIEKLSRCSNDPNPCCTMDRDACQAYQSFMPIILNCVPYICISAMIYFALLPLYQSYAVRKLRNIVDQRVRSYIPLLNKDPLLDTEDKGNSNENDRYHRQDSYLTVRRLKKRLAGKDVVDGINFRLEKGECLGLLGANGAGKTTTFRMLTREEIMDKGDIFLENNVKIGQDEYLKKLGYCPQNDALNYSLTGRVILETIAKLRGVRDPKAAANVILDLCDLTEKADTPCEFYSGGNKRKLSFAVAIIGLPKIVLLDEPTNGVDPVTRRKFWTLIKSIKDDNPIGFILTSHSMEECEALCNDVKIMKEGSIEAEGTISKLKSERGGFSVKIKIHRDQTSGVEEVDSGASSLGVKRLENIHALKNYLESKYAGSVKDEHPSFLHYYIEEKVRWSHLFKDFDELKNANPLLIEDYVISDATLEDVFLDTLKPSKRHSFRAP